MTEDEVHELTVGSGDTGRLDRFVSDHLELSRTRVQKLLVEGRITVDDRPGRKSEAVAEGQRVRVRVPPARPVSMEPEDLPLEIVYQDEHLAVVNKPAGMVVHPAPGHRSGTMVNALLFHVRDLSGVGGRLRPGIVHRLDRDTSGLLLVAKSDVAHLALREALEARRIRRIYRALVWGHLREDVRVIDEPIGRDPRDRKKMAVVDGGRSAVTRVRVAERWERADLLDVALQTGRTHQIRVHLSHIGHPVVGDDVYGAGWERGMGGNGRRWAEELARRVPRQFLHAAALGFDHPATGEHMRFHAELPEDLAAALRWGREPVDGSRSKRE
ncbi:MAG: RluA family pseudouridine synthase [Gemmatimonadota bacterium]|nr:RluA family pseudouridine synthase [Gemmatimonadota bacterium]